MITERKLSSQARKHLPSGSFVFPKQRKYPIEDKPPRNALARVSQHGSSEQKTKVRAAVHSKYPDIGEHLIDQLIPAPPKNESSWAWKSRALGRDRVFCPVCDQPFNLEHAQIQGARNEQGVYGYRCPHCGAFIDGDNEHPPTAGAIFHGETPTPGFESARAIANNLLDHCGHCPEDRE